jgi:predicted ATPase
MSRRYRTTNLPAPYLRRIWLEQSRVTEPESYPFCLPFLRNGFELGFDHAVTIIVGENGTGKSTLLEGIALRASWLPKVTSGWFFRAESFFSVARYLDEAAMAGGGGPPPDFLSHSHGEGFLRFFEERCQRQGIFIFDEPESALSPARQIEFLKLLRRMDESKMSQVIMATHSPMLMAYANARLLQLSKYGLEPINVEDTEHFRLMREFWSDPKGFLDTMVEE